MPTDNLMPQSSTSIIKHFMLRSSTTGQGLTGKVHSDFTGKYNIAGGAEVTLSFSSGSPGDSYSSGKIVSLGLGKYAWHVPNAVFASLGNVSAVLSVTGGIDVHCEWLVVAAVRNTAAFGAATPGDVSPTINFSPTIEPTELSAGSVSAIQSGLALESSVQSVITTLSEGVELDSATVTNIKSGLATSAALGDVQTDVDAANNYLSALSGVFSGITSMANWLRRGFRKDSGTAGMSTAQTEINTGGTATFSGLTDSLEAIRDNQQSSGGASLEDIIAGVQSVSGGIAAAQDESALYITIGDTWTQDVESLGNLTDKTVVFAIKSKARDADNAAVVLITEGTGLTRLNGAATTAGWGSIEILDEAAGNVRLRLESDATSLLTSGTYVDAIKALEDGDDRTLRQRGRTIVAAGVIADIT